MTEHHVGELRLRLHVDPAHAAQGESLRAAAEALVRAALERCADLLEAQAPGRVVLLRRLPLHWRLDDSLLQEPAEVTQLARSAAESIERSLRPARVDPPPDSDGPLAFDDEAQWRASHLLARVRGGPAWFHAALEDAAAGDPLAELAAPARHALALATLQHLARADLLVEVLAAQPPLAVGALATAWQCEAPAGLPTAASHDPAVTALLRQARSWPALPGAARRLALLVHGALLRGETALGSAARQLAAAVGGQLAAPDAMGEPSRVPASETVGEAGGKSGSDQATAGAAARPTLQGADDAAARHVPGAAEAANEGQRTRAAGLFLLLARVQELGLAEALWQACLPEPAVLATAARALLGSALANDPAAAWFGGDGSGDDGEPQTQDAGAPSGFTATAAQACDVAAAVCAALARALPRRGLAELPPLLVSLAEHASGRLLVAAAEGLPFAFFAWPADTRETLLDGLRALLAAWPHTAVISAHPALAQLDGSGRLLARRDLARSSLWLPSAASTPAAALLAVVAGAPCTLFVARLGASQGLPFPDPGGHATDASVDAGADDAAAFTAMAGCVHRWFLRNGQLVAAPERLDVVLAPDARDLPLRRAGLDQDPGWMPWMRRHVRFVFQQPAGGAASPPAG